jgi:hypothetical protein
MIEKLNREHFELKRTVENMKRGLKAKFDETRAMLGLETEIELMLRAKPGSKEQQALRLFLEAKERAEGMER